MSAFGPTPEPVPNLGVHPLERRRRHNAPMVVRPTSDDRVELSYQMQLTDGFVRLDEIPDFLQERVRVLFRRPYEQFAVELAEILSEEIKPLVNMRDASLLRRELQSPFVHKLLDEGEDFVFQHVLGRTGDDEVIRIPNQVDFRNGHPLVMLRSEPLL